jgi:cation transporter-like permease
MLTLVLGQLLSYSVLAWLAFVAVTVAFSASGKVPGMILGHCIVAAIVLALDIHWVRTAMASPTYNPNTDPDFDGVFVVVFPIGVLLRVIAINTVLLPVAFGAIWLRQQVAARPVA